MTLYDLTAEYLRLLEWAEDPDIDEETFNDTLEGLGGEIEDKADGYAKVIKQLEADAESLKKEAARLTERRRTIENNIRRMKSVLQASMEACDKRKFKTELFSFNIQRNAPSVKLSDDYMEHISDDYLIFEAPKVDKKKLLADLKDGKELDYATIEQGESLRIR